MGEWGAWRSVAAQIERRDGCVEWCLALPRNMDRFRVVFFNIRVGARAVGWTPTNASAAWRAFANQIADYENDLDWTLVVPRRLEQTRDAYFDVGIAADAIGWPVPSAPATHCDKKKLRTFLLRQKTAAYEQGMAASAEGDTRTFNAGYDIVHFLDWFIYLKLDSGMFDIREDEP